MSLEPRMEQEQKPLLLQEQYLELLLALYDERYVPTGNCPQCSRKLTAKEILEGFNDNPTDYTTCCTGCNYRFEPKLICFGKAANIELPFYCPNQALHQLGKLASENPDAIKKENPAVYRSILVHHGSLKSAFKSINIDYQFDEVPEWKDKVVPFLGKMQDTVIASATGQPVHKVRQFRNHLKIKAFQRK